MKLRMPKQSLLITVLVILFIASSCSKEDVAPPSSTNFSISQFEALSIDIASKPETLKWRVEAADPQSYCLTQMQDGSIYFAATLPGFYRITFTNGNNTQICIDTVNVSARQCSPYIAKIFDFMPAVGQFTNVLPDYKEGDTKKTILKKVEEYIAGENKKKYMISLGGFGGYVTFGFDHTIVNIPGLRDFRVLGNAFYANANPNPNAPKKGGSCEPGVIMVAYDRNKNGKPDDDEWYEIAGSEYNNPQTVHNYEITYYRPDPKKPAKPDGGFMSDTEYIRWTDNQGNSGYKSKNTFHNQSYFPSWIKEDKITFKGTLLPNNSKEESGAGRYWVLYAFDFGYVDNIRNEDDDSAIDIDWAVDAKGNKVHLPGVDFVKVYTGLNQECGWLGESSTEVMGANDLHLLNLKVKTR